VVVVDTGFDESGATLSTALAGRKVLAVLFTHAHPDHVAGADKLGAQIVCIGNEDLSLAQGTSSYKAPLLRLVQLSMQQPKTAANMIGVTDSQTVVIDEARFTAIAMPGHTPGGIAWQYRDVLFSGDAIVSQDGKNFKTAYDIFTDNPRQALRSLSRLDAVNFQMICDGHYGCTKNAKVRVAASIRRLRRGDFAWW
jgi:glyoxylase-like metal-dependent hydrolase (beta-lactamase superfamily II)